MIGSTLSRMAAAEKLSIGQLQQAIKDGTIPAYVGVPMLQDKMKQQQQAQAAAMGQQQQPPIAQQVMQEAQGIEQARSNLPEAYAGGGILDFAPEQTTDADDGYASGGIIAFAGGDLVDDDEEQYDLGAPSRKLAALNQAYEEGINALPVNLTPMAAQEFGINLNAPSGEGIREGAKAPRGFVEKIRQLESRGQHTDKEGKTLTSTKGAEGIMQVMPNTQVDPGFGVRPAKDKSQAELERVGIDYAQAMLRKYNGDEKLAAMAYNWGPGNVDKWIAGGMKGKVPGETRQYAANFAEGGEVKKFATGDYVGFGEEAPYDPNEPSIFSTLGTMLGSPLERIKNQTYGKGFVTNASLAPKAAAKDDWDKFDQATKAFELERENKSNEPEPASALTTGITQATANAAEKPRTAEDELADYLKDIRTNLAKQKEQDKYLSLMAAGFGTMGGTSPYAGVNIGQGAMKGVEAQMAARKQQQEAEKAQTMGMYRLGELQATKAYRQENLERQKQATVSGLLEKRYETVQKNVAALLKSNPATAFQAESPELLHQKTMNILQSDPVYNKLYKSAFPQYTPDQQAILDKYK